MIYFNKMELIIFILASHYTPGSCSLYKETNWNMLKTTKPPPVSTFI